MLGYPQSVEKWIETESLSSFFVNLMIFQLSTMFHNIEKSSNVTKIWLSIVKDMSDQLAFNLCISLL